MGRGLAAPSIETATSLTLGPRKRNVTVLSACTSGEISGGGAVCAKPVAVFTKSANKSKDVRFKIPPAGAFIRDPVQGRLCRGMIHQAAQLVVSINHRNLLRLNGPARAAAKEREGGLKSAPTGDGDKRHG